MGYRKFIVAMSALLMGTLVAMRCDASVVGAWGMFAGVVVTTYMGAHALADSKWSKGGADVPPA